MRAFLSPGILRRNIGPVGARVQDKLRRQSRRARAGLTSAWSCRPVEVLEGRVLFEASPADLLTPVPLGREFAVNTHTAGSQEFFPEAACAVAAADDGSFVVTWSSSGQDGSSWGVYAQRFDAAGAKSGDEFRVNQYTANSQWYPSVAADADGDFVVTWTSYLQDGSQSGIYARRYRASGEALGDEFRVNSTAAGNQRHPAVAMDDDGDFVVAWAGFAQSGGGGWDVYAQRYSDAGAKEGGEFRVNSTAAGDQQFASVAADAAGNFVVGWTTDAQDGSGTAVCARRFDLLGVPRGDEFQVNAFAAGNQHYARVASGAAGGFVVTWAGPGDGGTGRGIYARRYDVAGAPAGDEFRVNETTAGDQFAPTIAADPAGGFTVTWTTPDQDGSQFGIYARAYTPAGDARGGEFRVNSTGAGIQAYSAVAADARGGFVVAWESDGQDGGFFGIYGQRFGPAEVAPAAVVGRHLFYNDSAFDGATGGADPADGGAIATDKIALLAGEPSAFAHYSSYSLGINGVMVDVAGLNLPVAAADASAAAAVSLGAEDFAFKAGNGGDTAAWSDAAAPQSVTVRRGAGVAGSDRVTLVWGEGAVKNQWLQLTLKANDRTRLAAPDVFYFGNLVGDTGGGLVASVDRLDVVRTRRAFAAGEVPISSPYDHNRDGHVNLTDVLLIRRNVGQPPLEPLGLVPVPAAAPWSGSGRDRALATLFGPADTGDVLSAGDIEWPSD